MEIRTCEEYVLAELAAAKKRIEELEAEVEDLKFQMMCEELTGHA